MHDLLLEHGFPLKNNNALFFSMHIVAFSSVNKFTIGQIMSRRRSGRHMLNACARAPCLYRALKAVWPKQVASYTSIEAVSFALRVSWEEAPKIQTVKSTACASKKNKTFHRKAFFAAVHTSTHLFDTCDPMKVPRPLVALLLPKILIRLGCGVTIKTITILSSSFLLS